MIFVTIGSMFPFDRLIRDMDAWTAANPGHRVLAQICEGRYVPEHMEQVRRLSQAAFRHHAEAATLIVAHAGMGTVITAGRAGRPLVILPRIREWGEHTTDHQIATANWLRDKPGIFVADDDAALAGAIAAGLAADMDGHAPLSPVADAAFIERIRAALTRQDG